METDTGTAFVVNLIENGGMQLIPMTERSTVDEVFHFERKRSSDENIDQSSSLKRRKIVDESMECINVKQTLLEIHKTLLNRLDSIEEKVVNVSNRIQLIENKMNLLTGRYKNEEFVMNNNESVPEESVDETANVNKKVFKSAVSMLPLNCEDIYPDGSWLGDENDVNMRVRCCISKRDLNLINGTCLTPEKLALTLLDFLFNREIQACSNISGHSKHGKKQLDTLLIYGIHCHLKHVFQISEQQWSRIKKNLDSKCRTAHQRQQKGMSLKVKVFEEGVFEKNLMESSSKDDEIYSSCNTIINESVLPNVQTDDKSENISIVETMSLQGKPESVAIFNENKLEHQCSFNEGEAVADACDRIVTLDGSNGELISIEDATFSLLVDPAAITVDGLQEPLIIQTALGEVRLVHHTVPQHHPFSNVPKNGKIHYLTNTDLSL